MYFWVSLILFNTHIVRHRDRITRTMTREFKIYDLGIRVIYWVEQTVLTIIVMFQNRRVTFLIIIEKIKWTIHCESRLTYQLGTTEIIVHVSHLNSSAY